MKLPSWLKYRTLSIRKKAYAFDPRRTAAGPKSIFIACFAKSGSTYLTNLLATLTGLKAGDAMMSAKENEQDIYEEKLQLMLAAGAVFQQHTRATENNLRLLLKYGLRPIVLVRRLDDVLVSHHDHLEREDRRTPMGFLPVGYSEWCEEDKYLFLIRNHMPWFMNFYFSWIAAERHIAVKWLSYEELFADQAAVTAELLRYYGYSIPQPMIEGAVKEFEQKRGQFRFNVGRSGRGRDLPPACQKELASLVGSWQAPSDLTARLGY